MKPGALSHCYGPKRHPYSTSAVVRATLCGLMNHRVWLALPAVCTSPVPLNTAHVRRLGITLCVCVCVCVCVWTSVPPSRHQISPLEGTGDAVIGSHNVTIWFHRIRSICRLLREKPGRTGNSHVQDHIVPPVNPISGNRYHQYVWCYVSVCACTSCYSIEAIQISEFVFCVSY